MTEDNPHPRLDETAIVQNETLGAYALWKFGLAFQERDGFAATLPLAFLVLPLVLHGPTLAVIASTQRASGLHLFAGKLGEKREDLVAVHSRTLSLRQLTLESLVRAEQAGLIRIESTSATIRATSPNERIISPQLPDRIRRISPACEKVGHWFAGLSDHQVAHTLRVEF